MTTLSKAYDVAMKYLLLFLALGLVGCSCGPFADVKRELARESELAVNINQTLSSAMRDERRAWGGLGEETKGVFVTGDMSGTTAKNLANFMVTNELHQAKSFMPEGRRAFRGEFAQASNYQLGVGNFMREEGRGLRELMSDIGREIDREAATVYDALEDPKRMYGRERSSWEAMKRDGRLVFGGRQNVQIPDLFRDFKRIFVTCK